MQAVQLNVRKCQCCLSEIRICSVLSIFLTLNQLKKCDNQGNIVDYESEDERNSDLCNYFKNIYSKIPEKTLSLEQFLTPEIMNSEYVQSKKLGT